MLHRITEYSQLDERKLMDLYVEGNLENTAYFYPDEQDKKKAVRQVEQGFLAFLRNNFFAVPGSVYWVLEENGVWVSALRTTQLRYGLYYAEALETRPDCRRKGCAYRLLNEVTDELRKDSPFSLLDCVDKENTPSLGVHKKAGFRIVSDKGFDYLSGEENPYDYGLEYRWPAIWPDEEKRTEDDTEESIVIRREKESERREVEELVRESFWNVYRPGCLEHYVLHRLRDDPAFVPELDLVMEKDGRIIGQNMFMRAVIEADDGRRIPIMTMGPICIAPELKRKGYGKKLLDESLLRAAALGCGALCFEGNIAFYGKSGFTYASRFGVRYHGLPEGADQSFFLCRELVPGYLDGVKGEYAPPEGYFCCEREQEAFGRYEASFPPKEKKKLPGQLFE